VKVSINIFHMPCRGSPIARTLAIAFACLAHAGNQIDARGALARVLLGFNPAAGWQVGGRGFCRQATGNSIGSRIGFPRAAEGGSLQRDALPVLSRRSLLTAAGAAAAAAPALPSLAWCGERAPEWALWLQWNENPSLKFTYKGATGTVFYRIIGDQAREKGSAVPPVLVVGNPGIGYDYMETLEALTISDRRVVEVNFAGTRPGNTSAALVTPDACAEQLRVVCQELKLPTVHVVAHGLGALPALRFASKSFADAENGIQVRSLTLVSPYGSAVDLRPSALDSLSSIKGISELPAKLLPVENTKAASTCIVEASRASGGALLGTALTGTPGEDSLRGGLLNERLDLCADSLPVLLATGGARDIVNTDTWVSLPPNVIRASFPAAGHLPFLEQREEFIQTLLSFFDKADGKKTNREFKFSNDTLSQVKDFLNR